MCSGIAERRLNPPAAPRAQVATPRYPLHNRRSRRLRKLLHTMSISSASLRSDSARRTGLFYRVRGRKRHDFVRTHLPRILQTGADRRSDLPRPRRRERAIGVACLGRYAGNFDGLRSVVAAIFGGLVLSVVTLAHLIYPYPPRHSGSSNPTAPSVLRPLRNRAVEKTSLQAISGRSPRIGSSSPYGIDRSRFRAELLGGRLRPDAERPLDSTASWSSSSSYDPLCRIPLM
jgi:hypothetical protein